MKGLLSDETGWAGGYEGRKANRGKTRQGKISKEEKDLVKP